MHKLFFSEYKVEELKHAVIIEREKKEKLMSELSEEQKELSQLNKPLLEKGRKVGKRRISNFFCCCC